MPRLIVTLWVLALPIPLVSLGGQISSSIASAAHPNDMCTAFPVPPWLRLD
jgi:hypothetical protein